MKRSNRNTLVEPVQNPPMKAVIIAPPIPCIPIIISPDDLNGIYDHFMKARPSKRLPIGDKRMIIVYEGEGGNA